MTTGYAGTFLVDSKTADLVRLDIRTDRLPADTGACYASTTLDYARVRLKGIEFLLPSASVMRIDDPNGGASVNRTGFSNCHEFLGESSISFAPPAEGSAPDAGRGANPAVLTIPPGLRFTVALSEGIDTAAAAGGDPIKARLTTPIARGRRVIVPAGSAVAARIVRIQQVHGNRPAVTLDIRLETVDVAGAATPLVAVPDIGTALPGIRRGAPTEGIELGSLTTLESRSFPFAFRNISLPYLIGSGLKSQWVTAQTGPAGAGSAPSR